MIDTNEFDYGSFYKQKKKWIKLKYFFTNIKKVGFTGTKINAHRVIR